jgi:hypothetical protein
MRIIPDQLKSKNLVPFKKRHGRYNIPGIASENQVSMDRVDSDLSTEEQGYIRHYLGYADALIRSAEETAPLALPEEDLAASPLMINERRQELRKELQNKEMQKEETPAEAVVEVPESDENSAHKAA